MHENTPYIFNLPFFEIFRGAFAPLAPPMAPPLFQRIFWKNFNLHNWFGVGRFAIGKNRKLIYVSPLGWQHFFFSDRHVFQHRESGLTCVVSMWQIKTTLVSFSKWRITRKLTQKFCLFFLDAFVYYKSPENVWIRENSGGRSGRRADRATEWRRWHNVTFHINCTISRSIWSEISQPRHGNVTRSSSIRW